MLGFAAYPVGYGGEHVGGYDKEGEVGFEEGGAEDDEEEADGEDLGGSCQYEALEDRTMLQHTNDKTMIVLRPAMLLALAQCLTSTDLDVDGGRGSCSGDCRDRNASQSTFVGSDMVAVLGKW